MTDAYKLALNEFKEASAAVRHAFAVQMEARAAQITANREYITATDAHTAASERLAKADDALMMVKDQPEAPAEIDVTRQQGVGAAHADNLKFTSQMASIANGADGGPW